MRSPQDYASIAHTYATGVVHGVVPACRWTKAACQRQLDDLARAETPAFPYRYDVERGARVCLMLELLPHIKGRWASATIRLEAWQVFLLMTVFSWVFAAPAEAEPAIAEKDGLRRFRTVYVEVPRKNAKSTLTAGVALYMVGPDGEEGAECFAAATTRDQAKIVSDVARAMAKKSPGYCQRFGVDVLAHALVVPESESFLKALSADHDSLDGLNVHFASVDELHAHKTRGVWDVLETATGSREQPLVWAITTAGSNRAGICYEVRTYVTQILTTTLHAHDGLGYRVEGTGAVDETFFGIIYTVDDESRWDDPAEWAKANPNLHASVKLDDLERKCRKAQQLPSAQPNFLTKHLNVWVNADSAWMDMRAWDRCADPALSIEQFAGEPTFVGADLANKIDLASWMAVFRRMQPHTDPKTGEVTEKAHYYAFGRHYLPEETIEDSDNSQYHGWVRAGKLVATTGNIIDFGEIQEDLEAVKAAHELRVLAYDPYGATQFANDLTAEGFPMVEVGATVKNFSEPMKELEAIVRDGRFHHDGDPVLSWAISNVVAHEDRKQNIFPAKPTLAAKIDPAVALIMALSRAMFEPAPVKSVYASRGIVTL